MIDYAKKSVVAKWKSEENYFADYHSKAWGIAWITANISVNSGMKATDKLQFDIVIP
jgi:hypothetical protein